MDEHSELTPPPEAGRSESRAMRDYVAPEFCDYCGAKLNPLFYFCMGCATPYKNTADVIPRHRPRKLTGEELVAAKAPSLVPLMGTYGVVIIGTGLVSWAIFQDDRPDLQMYLWNAVFALTTCVVGAIYWRSLSAQFKQFGFMKWQAWAGLALLIPVLVINYGYHGLLEWLVEAAGWGESEDYVQSLRDMGMSPEMLIFSFCILPGITEEIGFRGLVQHWLQVAIKPWPAILVASALFSAVHFNLLSFPYLMGVGVLLGWVKWKTGSLYPSMLIHFLHNLIVIELF